MFRRLKETLWQKRLIKDYTEEGGYIQSLSGGWYSMQTTVKLVSTKQSNLTLSIDEKQWKELVIVLIDNEKISINEIDLLLFGNNRSIDSLTARKWSTVVQASDIEDKQEIVSFLLASEGVTIG